MSDRPIQAGDLVVVVMGCDKNAFGMIFKVREIYERHAPLPCVFCNQKHSGKYAGAERPFGGIKHYTRAPLNWLKRIPPLEELEGKRSEEKLKEPA